MVCCLQDNFELECLGGFCCCCVFVCLFMFSLFCWGIKILWWMKGRQVCELNCQGEWREGSCRRWRIWRRKPRDRRCPQKVEEEAQSVEELALARKSEGNKGHRYKTLAFWKFPPKFKNQTYIAGGKGRCENNENSEIMKNIAYISCLYPFLFIQSKNKKKICF